MSSSLVWLMLLAAYATTFVVSTDESINSDKYKSIFILAGQSNMAGRAGVIDGNWDNYVPPECTANSSILRLTANLTWEEARDPLHQGIDNKTSGIGPGMPFANSVLKNYPSIGVIGLVPCAFGGTSISEWSKGQKLYNQMLQRAQAAVSCGGGVIRAILWYQGEADADRAEEAANYKCRLKKFFTDVRADLQSPDLPIIQVALASEKPGIYTDEVRKAQLGIELPNVRCVDAWGLPLTGDLLHLDTQGEIQVGQMMAEAFLDLTSTAPPPQTGESYA